MLTDQVPLPETPVDASVPPADSTTEMNGMANEIAAPVVFQCCQCKTIVGDSSSISHMDPERRTMSIKRKVMSVALDMSLHTSTDEYDFGSTYHLFHCVNCKHLLGQMYRTTSAKLDHLRELYTYHSSNLTLYTLKYYGSFYSSLVSYQLCPDLEEFYGDPALATQPTTVSAVADTIEVGPVITGQAPQTNLGMEVVKLQKFCLYLLDRVQKLEAKRSKQ